MKDEQKVLVLLATYNGKKYLKEQIDSILNQKNVKIDILVSDDSSTDDTFSILEEYERKNKLRCFKSKCGSAQKNFYNLINNASEEYDYYALSDQDDVWLEDKIFSALKKLNKYESSFPLLYSGVSIPVDENLNKINRKEYSHYLIDNLGSSLVASNTQGCTIVFNNNFLKKIKNKTTSTSIMHDAWLHKTCLVLNGKVIFDNVPYMYYRQHENNVFATLGKSKSIFDKIKNKLNMFFNEDDYYLRSKLIKEWLLNYDNDISEETRKTFNELLDVNNSLKSKFNVLFSNKYKSPYKFIYLKFLYLVIIGKL